MSNYPPANDDEINKAMAKVIVILIAILFLIAGCHHFRELHP
jgi:hypothetical protein